MCGGHENTAWDISVTGVTTRKGMDGGIGFALDLAVSPSAAVGMAVKDVRACPDIIDGNADITNAPPQLVLSL